MRAKDIMQTRVVTLGPDMLLRDVGRMLERERISGAPVVGERRELLGVLSQTDLLRRYHARPAEIPAFYRDGERVAVARYVDSPGETRVAEAMTPAVLSAEEDTPVRDLARFMLAKRIHRVVIVRNGKLRGIVTSMDLLGVLAHGGTGKPGRARAQAPRRRRRAGVLGDR